VIGQKHIPLGLNKQAKRNSLEQGRRKYHFDGADEL